MPKGDLSVIAEGKDISFSYHAAGKSPPALDGVSLTAEKGELIALLGCNGCGKSTLAKHLNALLPIQRGELRVAGINVRNARELWRLRRVCGMVFQNPDNQFVSSVLEEDIAFGLENYGVPRKEIPAKVREALREVGLEGYEKRSPSSLSGGEKQRAALAGVLALEPELLVFDEVTSMLDPDGRREVLGILRGLRAAGKTVLMITHAVEEAADADRVALMHAGKILADGAPREILTDRALMERAELIPPLPVRLYYDLREAGVNLAGCPLTNEEFADEICRLK